MANPTKTKPKAADTSITRTVGYTKDDGTTDTYEAYVDPDGNILKYNADGPLIMPEYEAQLNTARDAADQDAIEDITEQYEDARRARVQRMHDRATQAQEGGTK